MPLLHVLTHGMRSSSFRITTNWGSARVLRVLSMKHVRSEWAKRISFCFWQPVWLLRCRDWRCLRRWNRRWEWLIFWSNPGESGEGRVWFAGDRSRVFPGGLWCQADRFIPCGRSALDGSARYPAFTCGWWLPVLLCHLMSQTHPSTPITGSEYSLSSHSLHRICLLSFYQSHRSHLWILSLESVFWHFWRDPSLSLLPYQQKVQRTRCHWLRRKVRWPLQHKL